MISVFAVVLCSGNGQGSLTRLVVNALVGVVVGLLFGLDLIERLLGVLAQRGQIGQHLPARLRAIGCAEQRQRISPTNVGDRGAR